MADLLCGAKDHTLEWLSAQARQKAAWPPAAYGYYSAPLGDAAQARVIDLIFATLTTWRSAGRGPSGL